MLCFFLELFLLASVLCFFLGFFLVLLSCSARGCFFFLGFCLVTYCSIKGLVSRVSLHEYFVTWWVFFCSFFELFLELLFLDLLSCCVRARIFSWWDGLADLLQSGLLLRTAGSVSLPEGRHVGAQGLLRN